MKPSQVFLGESLMSGVRPKKKPNMYAITSLQTIMETGTMNLITVRDVLLKTKSYKQYMDCNLPD